MEPAQRFNMGLGSSLVRNHTEWLGMVHFCSLKHNLMGNRYMNAIIVFVLVAQNLLFPKIGIKNLLDTIHPLLKWLGVGLQSLIAGYGIVGMWKFNQDGRTE
ncbi:MAG: hypothetical protein D6732_18555 [Methanobacteriota archaeon]|nr:MAG: hypothetical protein D6732_18555 [Euryarchaeota archaeon]